MLSISATEAVLCPQFIGYGGCSVCSVHQLRRQYHALRKDQGSQEERRKVGAEECAEIDAEEGQGEGACTPTRLAPHIDVRRRAGSSFACTTTH